MVQSVKHHLKQTKVGNTVDGSDIPNNHTTWDVQFLVNNGINYRYLNWFARRNSTINHLSWRKANVFSFGFDYGLLDPNFLFGALWFRGNQQKPYKKCWNTKGMICWRFSTQPAKTCDTTILYEILTKFFAVQKHFCADVLSPKTRHSNPTRSFFNGVMAAPFLWSYGGPISINSFLSPPTFVHKPHASPKITEIVVETVGRNRVAIPLDRSLTPSANIAIPAKAQYPPEQLDDGSGPVGPWWKLPLLGGSSQDL